MHEGLCMDDPKNTWNIQILVLYHYFKDIEVLVVMWLKSMMLRAQWTIIREEFEEHGGKA